MVRRRREFHVAAARKNEKLVRVVTAAALRRAPRRAIEAEHDDRAARLAFELR